MVRVGDNKFFNSEQNYTMRALSIKSKEIYRINSTERINAVCRQNLFVLGSLVFGK
jgi:hypothetical protein